MCKKPDPGTQLGFKILLDRGLCHEVDNCSLSEPEEAACRGVRQAEAVNIWQFVLPILMGGYVAFAFYRKYASRVRALILADTRAMPDSPEAKEGREDSIALARSNGGAAIAEKMLPKMLTMKTVAENAEVTNAARTLMSRQPDKGVIAALIALRDRPDSTPTLAQVAVPTLIVVGAEDTLAPPKDSEQMRAGIRGAQLVVIPNAAHLSNLEQPEAFNRPVRTFLKEL